MRKNVKRLHIFLASIHCSANDKIRTLPLVFARIEGCSTLHRIFVVQPPNRALQVSASRSSSDPYKAPVAHGSEACCEWVRKQLGKQCKYELQSEPMTHHSCALKAVRIH